MDSQLATVLNGSLDVQNGSQRAEASGPETEVLLDPEGEESPTTPAGNLQPCPVKAVATRKDALSINGKKPEVGGTCTPAPQETQTIGGSRQPITVKTGVPGLRSQPIRIKIVVPPRCKRPITPPSVSLTKDFARSHVRRPVWVSARAAACTETDAGEEIQISAADNEGEMEEQLHRTEAAKENTCTERDVADAHIVPSDGPDTSCTDAVNPPSGIKEDDVACFLQKTDVICDRVVPEEQTEPLDLSLPRKRDSRERRCGFLLDDSGCESSLIMEVDEYEGDGDRDVVEEDDDDAEDSAFRPDTHPSPAFFSSADVDTENLLLIDDQGVPYTLSPDGLKVPQVDAAAAASEGPPSDRGLSGDVEGKESSRGPAPESPNVRQSLEHAPDAPPAERNPSSPPAGDSPLPSADQEKAPSSAGAPEVFTAVMPDSSQPRGTSAQEPGAPLSTPSAAAAAAGPSQPFQILTSPSPSAPVLLLSPSSSSPQLSSAPVSLSLPLPVPQTPPGASTQMFLLLSSVSSGDSASTSTPIAVLDPSTGQLSQITASSALPLPSAPVNPLSRPVIRLGHANPPVILSGVNPAASGAVVRPQLSSAALQKDHASPIPTQTSDSDLGTEAISKQSNKPSAVTSSPHSQAASLTFDPVAQPSSEAEPRPPRPKFDSEHLPLDDHIYFSSAAAPPSPPLGPVLSSGKLEPLEPLEPLDSPAGSPTTMGPRRVLYCQLCPRVFFYLSDLERHAITHSQKKPHVCQQCGKAFKRSSHLQRHKHIHTGQRNFVCPICAKRFREAGELQRHQRVHTGEKPYQCQLCHTRFAERNTLRRHTKRKHPYHQVAMEMLNERRDRGGRGGGGGGVGGVQEEEESAEWYNSTVSNLDNSESEMDT